MIYKVKSCALIGLEGNMIDVEADASMGLPAFDIVGLPDASVKEAKDRVRAAIKNCNFTFPPKRYTVNLAPSGIKKEGSLFDLPIAVAILGATEQFTPCKSDFVLIGELSLSGEVRGVAGVLPLIISAMEKGFTKFIVPKANAYEAALSKGAEVYPVDNLYDCVRFLSGEIEITKIEIDIEKVFKENIEFENDFSEVKGQSAAKRALEITAAGGHNCLIIGTPGSGKSMLAKRLPSILPDMTIEEALETTKIYSVAGLLKEKCALITKRPFRSPHHTISTIGLVGGGAIPKPGELSLSHNGVLFLDELPEFKKDATEVMRQPMEDGKVNLTRVAASVTYPCQCMVVAAMNPCKCGYYGDSSGRCRCSESSIKRYLSNVSGPLLDRIDISVEASEISYADLKVSGGESSAEIKKRVIAAREIQNKRYENEPFFSNAELSGDKIEKYCTLTKGAEELIKNAYSSMGLSARGYSRILKVARTIADLEGLESINEMHVAEAISYRSVDKKFWN